MAKRLYTKFEEIMNKFINTLIVNVEKWISLLSHVNRFVQIELHLDLPNSI